MEGQPPQKPRALARGPRRDRQPAAGCSIPGRGEYRNDGRPPGGRNHGRRAHRWTRNLSPDGEFKPAPDLRRMYEEAGVTPDREVITYCQGGYRAAHSYLALRLLGYPKVRNYVGSWKEWGDRTELPIEVPSRQ